MPINVACQETSAQRVPTTAIRTIVSGSRQNGRVTRWRNGRKSADEVSGIKEINHSNRKIVKPVVDHGNITAEKTARTSAYKNRARGSNQEPTMKDLETVDLVVVSSIMSEYRGGAGLKAKSMGLMSARGS